MMINPPIDKLIEKTSNAQEEASGCKFTLCAVVSKRARYLQEQMPAVLEEAHTKSISYASQEVFDGKIKPIVG